MVQRASAWLWEFRKYGILVMITCYAMRAGVSERIQGIVSVADSNAGLQIQEGTSFGTSHIHREP